MSAKSKGKVQGMSRDAKSIGSDFAYKNLRVSSQPRGRKAFETDTYGVLQVRAHGYLCYLPPAAQMHVDMFRMTGERERETE